MRWPGAVFAAGQAVPALAHNRVVAVGELHDPVVDVRRPGGFPDLRQGGGGTAVTDVGQDAVVEEVAFLGHEADGGGQRCLADLPDVGAVDLDRAAGDVVQPRDQVAEGGLAGPAWPGQRYELAGVCFEVDTR